MRTRRSLLTYASGIVFTVATTLTALVATPLLLLWLDPTSPKNSATLYGAFRMLTDWYNYLTMLDFGLGAALSPLLARALGKEDPQSLRSTLGAGMRAYLRLTALIIGVGLLMTPFIVWQIQVPSRYANDLRWAWIISLMSFLVMGLGPLRTLADARQRGYWVNILMVLQCLIITGLSLVFARLRWGIRGQAWGYTLGIWFFFIMLLVGALRRNRGLVWASLTAPPDPGIRRAIWSLSLPSFLTIVSGRIGLLSDNLVAGGILGPAVVASLSVTVRLAGLAQTQLQAIGAATWAGLAELHAQGARDVFNRRLVELTTLVAVLGVAVLGPIAAYNEQFFHLWMGKKVSYAGDMVVIIAVVNAFLLGLFSLWGWCFAGTGLVRRLVLPTLAATVINITASLVLTRELGLVGPVLGTLMSNLAISLWWLPIRLRQDFGISLRTLLWAVAWPLIWGVPYALGLWWLAHSHQVWGWFGLAAETGAAALGFLILSGLVILSPTDRALWRHRLGALLRRGGNEASSAHRLASELQSNGEPPGETAELAVE